MKLLDAVIDENYDSAQALCKAGANVNCSDKNGTTPLYFAIFYAKNKKFITLLLEYGATFSAEAHRLAFHGKLQELKQLSQANSSNIIATDTYDRSAFHYAAAAGHTDILKTLIISHPLSFIEKDRGGNTPIFYAVGNGHLDTVKWLLENYPDYYVNDGDNNGNTLLHIAVAKGHLHIVQCLVAMPKSRFLNHPNINGNTPFYSSIFYQQPDIALWLATNTVLENLERFRFLSTEMEHLIRQNSLEGIQILMMSYQTLNADQKTLFIQTALQLAIQNNQLLIIQHFIEKHDVDINTKITTGHSLLAYAIIKEKWDIVQWLLQQRNLNFRINKNFNCWGFIDRNTQLRTIKNGFQKKACIQVITGMGGIGKTMLAKKYIFNEKEYNIIWWFKYENFR